MATQGTSTTLSMTQGTYIDISMPSDTNLGSGEFKRPAEDLVQLGGEPKPHVLGFVSEFPNVGTIEEVTEHPDIKVRYTHKASRANRIFFFTADNDQHTISIVAMPIHDHSSIYQGGPAYGTYAYDKIIEEDSDDS